MAGQRRPRLIQACTANPFLGSTASTCSFVPTCRSHADARGAGQAWPKATAQRREACFTSPARGGTIDAGEVMKA
jgi:hypothetical protein